MGLFSRRPKATDLHVGDPRFDDWEVVADYGDLETAKAFAGQLGSLGITCAITSDWELDRFGRGDIALRVPPESYGDATVALDGLDLD
ncbi:MAG: hypothetical protein MUC84_03595 [Solirubrobacteraceae bacterium]|jgi:hypothetical protein|nr:hypothetical protein [Solirubrobacteraceae bacterium]